MAKGTVGQLVSTVDLSIGQEVLVDHERFYVEGFTRLADLGSTVHLVPQFGPDWDLEVAGIDMAEPIWELV